MELLQVVKRMLNYICKIKHFNGTDKMTMLKKYFYSVATKWHCWNEKIDVCIKLFTKLDVFPWKVFLPAKWSILMKKKLPWDFCTTSHLEFTGPRWFLKISLFLFYYRIILYFVLQKIKRKCFLLSHWKKNLKTLGCLIEERNQEEELHFYAGYICAMQ